MTGQRNPFVLNVFTSCFNMAQRVFCNRLVILAVTESSTGGFYGYFETFLEQIGMHNAYVKIGSYPTGP